MPAGWTRGTSRSTRTTTWAKTRCGTAESWKARRCRGTSAARRTCTRGSTSQKHRSTKLLRRPPAARPGVFFCWVRAILRFNKWMMEPGMPDMKEVKYNGILTFRIPKTWDEERDSEGLGVYYLPTPDSGTLRVTLLSFRKPGGARNLAEYARVMEKTLSPGPVERLTNGHLLKR